MSRAPVTRDATSTPVCQCPGKLNDPYPCGGVPRTKDLLCDACWPFVTRSGNSYYVAVLTLHSHLNPWEGY